MAKRRAGDRGKVADIDQILLELFAGQLLLEPAAGPAEPVARPAAKTNARGRKRPAASGSRDG
jgi:hypothetical protein